MSEALLMRIESKLDGLITDVAVLKADVAELKTDVAVLKADVAVLKADVAELKTDVAVLKTDVAVLKTDVAVLKTDVAVLKADVAELKTDVAVLKYDVERLGVAVGDLQVRASEARAGMDVMSRDIHKLHVLQEAIRSDAKVPYESDAGLREHMDRQFDATRREFHEALAPLELTLRAHTAQLNAGHGA